MKNIVAALCMCLLFVALGSTQQLPNTVVPVHYQLTLTPDLDNAKFAGDETLNVRLEKPASAITLNALEITFDQVTVAQGGSTQTAKVTADPKQETATLSVDKPLQAGTATLHIRYTGLLNEQMRGFYLSKTEKRNYAFTQFENTDARRAYPSFDQPDMKATFQVTLVIDKDDMAISNTKVVSDTPGPGDGKHTVKFDTTPKMSSYLLAMAVGDFECESGQADGIPIRVCGTPDKKGMGQFALQAAEYTLHYYDRYFGIKYPYGKLDFIGAPDFSAGAMENIGCIVARDLILFVDPKSSSYQLQKAVAQAAVAHEMAHQWFGDLVTMKWWDDVWLNEGFATWMSFKPTESWKPEWGLETDKVQSSTAAMQTDSLNNTHPIHQHAETPAEIQELFDAISYNKAAAVLNMVEGYVTPEVFRKGVNAYLSKHAYGNATSADFWNEIAAASKKPVDKIMSSFVTQPGVPQVSASLSCQNGSTKATLTQQRYYFDRSLFNSGSNEMWQIPVCLKSGGAEKCQLLASKTSTIEIAGCKPVDYNAGSRGYYRSGYDADNLAKLASIAEQNLSPAERVMLVNDAWAQVRVDRIKIGDFLAVAENLKNDPTRALWDDFAAMLRAVDQRLVSDSDAQEYHAWVRNTFGPVGEKLGWTPGANDSEEQRALRADLLNIVGETGRDPKIESFSRNLVEKALNGEQVDANLLYPALAIAARNGDVTLYEAIQKHGKEAKSPEVGFRDLTTLGRFEDPALIQRSLEYSLSPDVRSQDVLFILGSLMNNPAAKKPTWEFVRAHWPELEKKLSNYTTGPIVSMADSFCDTASRDQVQQFFTEHHIPSAERTLKQTLETINECVDLRSQQQNNLASWLKQQQSGTTTASSGQ